MKYLNNIIYEVLNYPSFLNRDNCLPKDYTPGKKYNKTQLAKMFICYTGKPNKFPLNVVKEWLYPGPDDLMADPMKLTDGRQTFTIKQQANLEDRDTRNITTKIINLDPKQLHKLTTWAFSYKMKAPDFKSRVNYQINKIKNNNLNTLIITPDDKPIIFESFSKNELNLLEGWHRVYAILTLIENKEITI